MTTLLCGIGLLLIAGLLWLAVGLCQAAGSDEGVVIHD